MLICQANGMQGNRAEQKRAHAGEVPNTITSSSPKNHQIYQFKLLTFWRWIFVDAAGKRSLLAKKWEIYLMLLGELWDE